MSADLLLGYVGLGNQGAPMARRLVDWPGGLVVFDVRAEATAPLAQLGARVADDLAAVAAADVISVTVLTDAQVRDVVGEIAGHARPGTVVAIHSTIEPETAAELRQTLERVEQKLRALGYANLGHVVEFFGVAPQGGRIGEAISSSPSMQ